MANPIKMTSDEKGNIIVLLLFLILGSILFSLSLEFCLSDNMESKTIQYDDTQFIGQDDGIKEEFWLLINMTGPQQKVAGNANENLNEKNEVKIYKVDHNLHTGKYWYVDEDNARHDTAIPTLLAIVTLNLGWGGIFGFFYIEPLISDHLAYLSKKRRERYDLNKIKLEDIDLDKICGDIDNIGEI